MMNVKELRLGNLVESSIEEIGMLKVLAITTARNTHYVNGCDIKFIKPIPLTMDNLEELGFTYDESTSTFYWKHSHWLRVQMFPKGGGILLISGKQHTFLDYVHEVQNIFSSLLKENI